MPFLLRLLGRGGGAALTPQNAKILPPSLEISSYSVNENLIFINTVLNDTEYVKVSAFCNESLCYEQNFARPEISVELQESGDVRFELVPCRNIPEQKCGDSREFQVSITVDLTETEEELIEMRNDVQEQICEELAKIEEEIEKLNNTDELQRQAELRSQLENVNKLDCSALEELLSDYLQEVVEDEMTMAPTTTGIDTGTATSVATGTSTGTGTDTSEATDTDTGTGTSVTTGTGTDTGTGTGTGTATGTSTGRDDENEYSEMQIWGIVILGAGSLITLTSGLVAANAYRVSSQQKKTRIQGIDAQIEGLDREIAELRSNRELRSIGDVSAEIDRIRANIERFERTKLGFLSEIQVLEAAIRSGPPKKYEYKSEKFSTLSFESPTTMKKVYLQFSLNYHPDKVAQNNKKAAEEIFKKWGEKLKTLGSTTWDDFLKTADGREFAAQQKKGFVVVEEGVTPQKLQELKGDLKFKKAILTTTKLRQQGSSERLRKLQALQQREVQLKELTTSKLSPTSTPRGAKFGFGGALVGVGMIVVGAGMSAMGLTEQTSAMSPEFVESLEKINDLANKARKLHLLKREIQLEIRK